MENVNAIEDKNSESTTSVQYIVVKIGMSSTELISNILTIL